MSDRLAVLIPTRGRPDNVRKVIGAWDFTNAWAVADMVLIVDADDPEIAGYRQLVEETSHPDTGEELVCLIEIPVWEPMVYKLDGVAWALATGQPYFALGFAGDDHLPRTIGWAQRYLTVLRELGTGMVYGDDGHQGANLSTEWAVTADAVRELGRMVPAPVEHLYCDNAVMELFGAAGALRHLPEVRIEHMHPTWGKAETDAQYRRVNSNEQYRRDRLTYQGWQAGERDAQVAMIRQLRGDRADVSPTNVRKTRPKERRPVQLPFPRHFKKVTGATPPEIELALADFASQVPADQEIVELGVYQGRTALIMAWGAQRGHGAHVTGIDPWDLPGNVYDPPFTDTGSKNWARYNVQALGFNNHITLVQGFSQEVAGHWPEGWYAGEREVGLLFVDGDHTYDGARGDIEAWAPHLAPDAVIAVDDYGHPDWPGVAEAVDALVAEGFLEPVQIFHERLAVTRLKTDGVEPGTGRTSAITSEGVSPSPEPPVMPFDETLEPDQPVERVSATGEPVDIETSKRSRDLVYAGELEGVAEGRSIDSLTLPELKALAKRRGIVLGRRKDKRSEILQALRDGE